MNGYVWKVVDVPYYSEYLIDRTGKTTVATTDPNTFCIYMSDTLYGDFRKRVLAHELGHVACFSYHLIEEIHSCCYPSKWIQMEEFICNFVADYGEEIFNIAYEILGDGALIYAANQVERMVS